MINLYHSTQVHCSSSLFILAEAHYSMYKTVFVYFSIKRRPGTILAWNQFPHITCYSCLYHNVPLPPKSDNLCIYMYIYTHTRHSWFPLLRMIHPYCCKCPRFLFKWCFILCEYYINIINYFIFYYARICLPFHFEAFELFLTLNSVSCHICVFRCIYVHISLCIFHRWHYES